MTATRELWERHKEALRGYLARRVRDPATVDDILQDTFLKAHASLLSLRTPGSVKAWLYRIASNALADHYRAQGKWRDLPDDLPAPEREPEHAADLAACIRPFLADLPDRYRLALTLSEIEGLPQREVARRLGLSLSGAKSRVQRGREMLRRRLLQCCDVEMANGRIVDHARRKDSCDPDCS